MLAVGFAASGTDFLKFDSIKIMRIGIASVTTDDDGPNGGIAHRLRVGLHLDLIAPDGDEDFADQDGQPEQDRDRGPSRIVATSG